MASRLLIAPDGSRGLVDETEAAEAIANGYREAPTGPTAGDVARFGGLVTAGAATGGGIAAAGSAAGRIARNVASNLPAAGSAVGRATIGAERTRAITDLAKLAQGPQAAAPAPTPAPTPAPAPASAPASPVVPTGRQLVTDELIARHPEALANYRAGDTIANRELDLIRRVPQPKAGSAAGRAAKVPAPSTVKDSGPAKATEPSLSVVEGGAKADLSKVPKWRGGTMSEAGTRHDSGYFSRSQAKRVPIEDMSQPHLRAAWEKHARELKASQRPAPVKEAEFERMTAELKHRASQEGALTAYDRPQAGSAAGRAARVTQAVQEVNAGPAAAAGESSLERQLGSSVTAARAANAAGASAAERQALMSALRGALGPAANLALMVLGAPDIQSGQDDARQQFQEQLVRQGALPKWALRPQPQGF